MSILVLTSSVLGEASISNQLVQMAVDRLRARHPGTEIKTLDLGRDPIPHLTLDAATALRGGEAANAAQAAAQALSAELVADLRAADTIVIGAPMYNFGIASNLKTWFDYVLRAGITFRYTKSGPIGLLDGKRAIVIESRGGLYSEGPAQALDSQEPHLRGLLNFIGITDVTFVRAERLAFGPEVREQAIHAAHGHLSQLIATEGVT